MQNLIVLDVEVKKDFHEVGGRGHFDKLGISVAGVYDYVTDEYKCFEESELAELEKLIQAREGVIGYNIMHFDYTVLQPYFSSVRFEDIYTIDLMKHLEEALGFRLPLNAVAQATLGTRKSGSGRDAVPLYRAGKMAELKQYCIDDVRLTKELYDYGREKGSVSFLSKTGETRSIEANWARVVARDARVRTLLSKALEEKRMVHIIYGGGEKGETTERDIEVQAIRGTAVDAYCHLRKDRRRFKLEHIVSCEVKEKA